MMKLNTSPIVDKSLSLNLRLKRKSSLVYAGINVLLLAIILYDISNKCKFNYSALYIEYTAVGILILSLVYNTCRYLYNLLIFEPVAGTGDQRRLLGYNDKDSSFVLKKTPEPPKSTGRMSINVGNMSWHSSFNESAINLTGRLSPFSQLNSSLNNNSFNKNQTMISPNKSNQKFTSPYHSHQNDDLFTDEVALQSLLRDISNQDMFNNSIMEEHKDSVNSMAMMGTSFWNHSKSDDYTELLRKSVYQLSPTIQPPNFSVVTGKEDVFSSGMPVSMDLNNSFEEGKFSSAKLSHFVTNLKRWISGTILERLVNEINNIDQAFKLKGFADLQIGQIGLERLKKTAENQLVVTHIPMLPVIIPFLELTSNQEYLVNRIKDMAKGTCISDYHWNSGSSYNHTSWDEHLPTDSAIIFHLFSTYMDGQLLPLPQPGGRPFFRYVVVGDKKAQKETLSEVKNKAKCAILCTNLLKPTFNLISDDKIHSSVPDRNNLFHVITQFLIYMKTHQDGFLDGVNLGRSGVNILCVVED